MKGFPAVPLASLLVTLYWIQGESSNSASLISPAVALSSAVMSQFSVTTLASNSTPAALTSSASNIATTIAKTTSATLNPSLDATATFSTSRDLTYSSHLTETAISTSQTTSPVNSSPSSVVMQSFGSVDHESSTASSAQNTSQAESTDITMTTTPFTSQSPSSLARSFSLVTSWNTPYAPYTSQSPASSVSQYSMSPSSLQTSSGVSPELSTITAENIVTESVSPTPRSVVATDSGTKGTKGTTEPASVIFTSSVPRRLSSSANILEASSLLSPTQVSVSNSSVPATISAYAFSPSSTSTPATQTPSPRPTIPSEGTRTVQMEVSLDMKFIDEYSNVNSPEYKELESNLTSGLAAVYKNVDGFVDIRILFITKGSVVCSYIVILAKSSEVTKDRLKKVLDQGSKDGTFPFHVKSINVVEEPTGKPEEKLSEWALVTMIVLGVVAFVFLLIAICTCVKYKRSMSGENDIYCVSSGELGMHTYETVSMGHKNDTKAKTDEKVSTAQRRLVVSHTNPTYGSRGGLDD